MATRKRGMKSIPNALSQGKDVFPITAFRNKLQIAIGDAVTDLTSANNAGEEVDLDLQFEDNEVLDVWQVHLIMTATNRAADVVSNGSIEMCAALLEDPDKANTTDIVAENFVENDSSLLYLTCERMFFEQAAVGQIAFSLTREKVYSFVQPYTVARNVKWILQSNAVIAADEFDSIDLIATIWGRRRNASDAEFKNIIYRQRF